MQILSKCLICDGEFKPFVLESHFLWCSNQTNKQAEEIQSKCNECDKNFLTKGYLEKHQKNIHEHAPKRFRCDICENDFFDSSSLKNHIYKTHDMKKKRF